MKALHPFWTALCAGLVPVFATHAALLLNLNAPGDALDAAFRCMPYWDGCVSISRAVRSGPGLILFRVLMVLSAVALALTWISAGRWFGQLRAGAVPASRWVAGMGVIGALFLLLYVSALGTEGPWYSWMRRYGVVVYFGLTALAQLVLARYLWPLHADARLRNLRGPLRALLALVSVEWLGGVASVAKRLVLSDPELVDRVENVIEWWFALALSGAFVALALLMRRSGYRSETDVGSR